MTPGHPTLNNAQVAKTAPRWRRFVLLILLTYLLPTTLIFAGVIPFSLRFHVLIGMAIIMAVYSGYKGFTPRDLGFRTDTLWPSLRWAVSVSLGVIAVLAVLAFFGAIREPTIPPWRYFFLFYILISSPAQEFLFRSVVFAEMDHAGIKHPGLRVGLSAVNFTLLHLIYHDALTLAVGLLAGILWGILYERFRNFWAVALSHALLGAFSIFIGLV